MSGISFLCKWSFLQRQSAVWGQLNERVCVCKWGHSRDVPVNRQVLEPCIVNSGLQWGNSWRHWRRKPWLSMYNGQTGPGAAH